MDEKTIIYTLSGVIAAIMGFVVRRELKREKDIEAQLKEKDTEIARLNGEVKLHQEWRNKLYEEAIQKRIQNGSPDRR